MTELDFSKRYKVEGYGGVAWAIDSYVKERDEDYEWSGIEVEDTDRVRCYMVGDDSIYVFDVDELTELRDDEYCPECGQIGCSFGRMLAYEGSD